MANVVYPFEEILQFEGANSQPPQRALACVRCHSQKLRCVRSNENTACHRCMSADTECVARKPQRLGRPSESHASSSIDAFARRRRRTSGPGGRGGHSRPRQDSGSAVSVLGLPDQVSDAPAIPDVFATGTSASVLNPITPAVTAPAASSMEAPLLSPTILSRGSYNPWSWLNADVPDQVHHGGVDEKMAAQMDQPADVPEYHGPPTAMGRLSTLLPDFDDLSSDSFDSKMTGTPETMSGGGNIMSPAGQELVSRLAQLLLDLHLCLGSVRSLDSRKRAMVLSEGLPGGGGGGGEGGGASSGSTTPSSSSLPAESVEQAFKAAETFLDVLKLVSQPESGFPTTVSNLPPARNGSTSLFDLAPPPNIPDPLDMSTRLMVTSCYTKLLEIFEVLVSLLLMSQASGGCQLSTVSLKIGSFSPAANKELAVSLLTQYVTHLLDAIATAVENSSCMDGLSHVARETKKVETKLREQISTVRRSLLS